MTCAHAAVSRPKKMRLPRRCFSPPPSFPAAAAKFAASPAGMEAYRFSMQSLRSWADQTLESEATKTLFGSLRHVFRRLARRCWRRRARLAVCFSPAERRQQSGQRRNASRFSLIKVVRCARSPSLASTRRRCRTCTCAVPAVILVQVCRWHREETRRR